MQSVVHKDLEAKHSILVGVRITKLEYDRLKEKLDAYEYLQSENVFRQRDRVRKVVASLDKDGNKVIDWEEFKAFAAQYGEDLSEKEAKSLIRKIDKDGNGTLDADEFYDWWKAPLGDFDGSKLQAMHIRLRAKDLPLEEVSSVKRAPLTRGASLWGKMRTAMNVVQYYKTTWKKLPSDPAKLAAMQQSAAEEGKILKQVTLVRHGQSEANAAWDIHKCETWHFDPSLTELGQEQARERQMELEKEGLVPQLVVASPMQRTLQTCLYVCSHLKGQVPFITHPLIREYLTSADDIGSMRAYIQEKYPEFNHDIVPYNDFWWYIPPDSVVEGETLEDHKARYKARNGWREPIPHVAGRVSAFEKFLVERPETNFIVVTHGDFIECMTGANLKNAQKVVLEIDPLKPVVPRTSRD
eukprot:TRINITY_DN4491_c0_g1_i1.p1 TRINITY_DN4491_c0_g1~~TRINITY_DN4491_c0_g1_i1.p1  ORF type:complete len:412 (+),score=64.16 TRINITY_DN4491_c0_g1_i1:72-1307(+)